MHLPQELQHFSRPTLITISDHFVARFFLVGGDALEELDGIALPKNNPHDDGSRVEGLLADLDDTPRLIHFVKQIAERLDDFVKKNDTSTIHLIMPTDVAGELRKYLSAAVLPHLGRTLHLDLMKTAPLDIVRRVLEKE